MNILKNRLQNLFTFFVLLFATMFVGIKQVNADDIWTFEYNGTNGNDGSVQTFTVPSSGNYKLEVWGGEGGKSGLYSSTVSLSANGGPGSYSKGELYLIQGQVLYIYVGGKGADSPNKSTTPYVNAKGGYNGGGNGTLGTYLDVYSNGNGAGAGGGATHIATRSGLLQTLSGYRSTVLIVAGGGGGAADNYEGGSAGGYLGNPGKGGYGNNSTNAYTFNQLGNAQAGIGGKGGTQTSGYSFGLGETATGTASGLGSAGGGAGWYGGNAGDSSSGTAGGGSGYISPLLSNASMTCYYCSASSSLDTYTYVTTHKSDAATPSVAKTGNGYAKISKIVSSNTQVADILVFGKSIDGFDPEVRNYTVYYNKDKTSISLLAMPQENGQVISYPADLSISASGAKKAITVTAEDGTVGTYIITLIESDPRLGSLSILDGILSPSFSPDIYNYDVKLNSETTDVNISASTVQNVTTITSGIGNQSIASSRNIEVKTLTPTGEVGTYYLHFQASNAQLLDIKVNGTSISGFTPTTHNYSVYVPYDATKINAISATKMENSQTVNLPSNLNLTGPETVKVVSVTAEDGSVGTYTITIIKADPRLASLTISNGSLSPDFDPSIREYDVKINPTISAVNITATTLQEKTRITSGIGITEVDFGNSDKTITTVSAAGDEYSYVLHMKKTITYLTGIKVNGTAIADFSPENLSYTVYVPYNTTSVTLEGIKGDAAQTITYPENLELTSTVTTKVISVTAEDGTITNYIVRIDKDDARLSSIEVSNATFTTEFNPDVKSYDVVSNIFDASSVKITATPILSSTSVAGDGEVVIGAGNNTKTITTTSATGKTVSYTLNIIKAGTATSASYSYVDKPQVFIVPKSGIYFFQGWGASASAKGGYVAGYQHMKQGDILYIYTGKTGDTNADNNVTYVSTQLGKASALPNDKVLFKASGNCGFNNYTNGLYAVTSSAGNVTMPNTAGTGTMTGNSGNGYVKVTYQPLTSINSGTYTASGAYSFTAKVAGNYKLEVWGAQGGTASITDNTGYHSYRGGYGGYAKGVTYLEAGQTIYIYNGGSGNSSSSAGVSLSGGYNGGGSVTGNSGVNHVTASGGGATHIATTNRGVLSTYNLNRDEVLIVAGGGGGGRTQPNHDSPARWGVGGSGGGYRGEGAHSNFGTTTTDYYVHYGSAGNSVNSTGNAFGQGQNVNGGSAGGGGWFGGYGSNGPDGYSGSGSGGSGHIANPKLTQKVMNGYNVGNYTANADYLTYNTTSVQSTPTSGAAKSGSGASKILYVGYPYLADIKVNGASITGFDPEKLEYTVAVDASSSSVSFAYTVSEVGQTVSYPDGTNLGSGLETTKRIVSTAVDGVTTATYTIKIERADPRLKEINVEHGVFNRAFDPDIYSYNIYADKDYDWVDISATPLVSTTKVDSGVGRITVPVGTTKVIVTSINAFGSKAEYTLNITRAGSSDPYLKDIKVDGISVTDFDPETLTYNIPVDIETESVTIEAIKRKVSQEVYLPADLSISSGTTTKEIKVIAEDGVTTSTYKLNFIREHSSKLKLLDFGYNLYPYFDPNITDYYIEIPPQVYAAKATYETYDEEAKVKVTGNGYMKNSGTIKVNVTEPNSTTTTYTIVIIKEEVNADSIGKVWNYPYTGQVESFTAPHTGPYKLEVWGAQGGSVSGYTGGYGGYARGTVRLNKGQTIYIVSGGAGKNATAAGQSLVGEYNGGGSVTGNSGVNHITASGGGATHIALTNKGVLSNYSSSRNDVLIVAGGGGGSRNQANHVPAARWGDGGAGGGYSGQGAISNFGTNTTAYASTTANAGKQTSGYAFGQGQSGDGNAAGGGGWYGGYGGWGGPGGYTGSGSGGSGYIGNELLTDKVMYGYNVPESSDASTKTISTTRASMTPTSNYAKGGSGYARITALKEPSEDNYLISLASANDIGRLSPEFEPATQEYTLTLADEESVKINATAADPNAVVTGTGEYEVKTAIDVNIVVKAESGALRTYVVHVVRKGSPISDLNNIKINGLIADFCKNDESYCITKPENFSDPSTTGFISDYYEYKIVIPYQIKSLNFQPIKNMPGQTVVGGGTHSFVNEETTVTITSTSEDGDHTSTYTYTIVRDILGVADLKELALISPQDPDDYKDDIDFDPNITEYKIAVPNNVDSLIAQDYMETGVDYTNTGILKIVPEAIGTNGATYTLTGNDDLVVGEDNEVQITVMSKNGTIKTYKLIVYREQEDNVYLRNIEVKNGDTIYELSPKFNKLTRDYIVTVPNEASTINLEAYAEDETAFATGKLVVSGTGTKTLKTGKNPTYEIYVITENCLEIYTVTITREKNSDPRLESIVVKDPSGKTYDFTETFDPDKIAYTTTYENTYSTVDFDITPIESTTKWKLIGNNVVTEGNNVKRIMAIAEDGTSKTYNIIINKVNMNNNNYLDEVIIRNSNGNKIDYTLSPSFDKLDENYKVIMPASFTSGSVRITGIPEDSLASVYGNDVYSINVDRSSNKPGFVNEVTLTVTADNGDTRDYTFTFVSATDSYAGLCSANITLSGDYTMTPDFDGLCGIPTKDIDEYVVDYTLDAGILEDSKVNIDVTGSSSSVVITGDVGELELDKAQTIFRIKTVSYDGTSEINYKFTINRQLNDNTNITKLDIPKSINHSSEILTSDKGAFELPENVVSLSKTDDWIIELEDPKASYTISGDDVAALSKGENTFIITVTAENGSTKSYNVTVNRQNNHEGYYLSSLSVDKGELSPSFDRLVDVYEVLVGNEVKKINISAISETFGLEVEEVGTHNLDVGWNYFKLTIVDDLDNPTERYKTYFVNVYRSEADEARLSKLEIKDTMINPSFDKDTYQYSVSTHDKRLDFTSIIPVDENATYEVSGNEFETVGDYEVVIIVTAADGKTTKEYKINVNRKLNANTYLKALVVEDNTLDPATFNKNTTLYSLETEDEIIYITALPEAETSTVTGDGAVRLITGSNILEIVVTSEAGTQRTYIIDVTQLGNGNNKIRSLTIHNGELKGTFVPSTINYDVVIPYEETELDMTVVLDDNGASYTVLGNSNLEVGDNTVYIMVTAPNGNLNTYTLNVKRERIISAYLAKLDEANYNQMPTFDKYVTNYKFIVNNETTSLDLDIEAEDDQAEVVIEGNENFTVGHNEVTITVTRKDDDGNILKQEVYTLEVERQIPDNSYLNYLYTDEGELSPDFDKDTMRYTVNVENAIEQIEVFAEASVKSATVTGTGVYDLEPGENEIAVKVTTVNNVERTYYITVIRAKKTGNFLLSLLATSGNTTHVLKHAEDSDEGFDKNIKKYVIDVDNDIDSITFTGRVSDGATVTGLGEYPIYDAGRTVKIIVTSEAGVENIYEVLINRELSDNNELINLVPSSGDLDPEFMYGETEYELVLDSSVSKLSFEVELEHQFASVKGNEEKVVPNGTSTRTITVKSESGIEKEYHVTVIKEITDNSILSELRVEDASGVYPLNETWEPDTTFTYSVDVPFEKKVLLDSEVYVTPDDPDATVEKSPTMNLSTKEENKYLIIVTAKDGITTSTYTLIINRAKNNDSTLSSLEPTFGMFKETFNPTTTEYTWKVPNSATVVTSEDFNYTLSDNNATVQITDDITLSKNEPRTISIIVTSEDGSSTTTYNMNVSYDEAGDATLKSLIADKGMLSPDFAKDKYKYDLYLYTTETEVTLTAEPSQATSTVVSGDGLIKLTKLNTTTNIVVQAENGMIETYVVNIHKNISTVTELRDIRLYDIDEYDLEPDFKAGTYNYEVDVPYDYEILYMEGIKSSGQQSIKYYVDGEEIDSYYYELPLDKTTVTMDVYNGFNEKTSTYTLVVNRLRNTNNYLSDLTVYLTDPDVDAYDLTPTFDKETQEYKIMVDMDVTSVIVDATKESDDATLSGTGTKTIGYGSNKIKVTVTSQAGVDRDYIVDVKKGGAYLGGITIDSDDIGYTDETYEYDYDTKKDSVEVVITKKNASQVITSSDITLACDTTTCRGTVGLEVGDNEFKFNASAYSGALTEEYTLNINRMSSDTTLKELTVDKGILEPNFRSDIHTYDLYEYVDETDINITAVPNSDKAKGVTGDGNVIISGSDTDITHQIVVEAENGSKENPYTINIHKTIIRNPKILNLGLNGLDAVSDACFDNRCTLSPVFQVGGTDRTFNIKVPYEYIDLDVLVEHSTIQQTHKIKIDGEYVESYTLPLGITPVVIELYDGFDELYDTYTLNVNRLPSDNNYLSSLSTTPGTLSPTFNRIINNYSVDVSGTTTSINVTAIAAAAALGATVSGDGNVDLEVGITNVNIVVTSPSGIENVYTIAVHRGTPKLGAIKLDGTDVYEDGKKEYDYTTKKAQIPIEILFGDTPTTIVSSDLSLTSDSTGYRDMNVSLNPGNNTITFRSETTDGGETFSETYTLNIYREDDDATLKSLTVAKGKIDPVFDPAIDTYDVYEYLDEVDDTITAVANSEASATTITGDGLVTFDVDDIERVVTVTAENGTTKDYTINFHRSVKRNPHVLDIGLNGLDATDVNKWCIDGKCILNPSFEESKTTYSIKVPYEYEELDMYVDLETTDAYYKLIIDDTEITSTYTLPVGTTLATIEVYDGLDKKINTYMVVIQKGLSDNALLDDLDVENYGITGFDPETNNYSLVVPATTDKVNVIATPGISGQTITGDGIVSLNMGVNNVEVVVKSPSGVKQNTYTIVITRASAELSSVEINEETITPEIGTGYYKYEIAQDEVKIQFNKQYKEQVVTTDGVTYTCDDDKCYATVPLIVGENTFVGHVDYDGVTKDYTLKITRVKSDNAIVTDIRPSTGSIAPLNPSFNNGIKNYTITIYDESIEDISFEVDVDNKYATVAGNETTSIDYGTKSITIVVTAEDGVTKNTFVIDVTKIKLIKDLVVEESVTIAPGDEYDLVYSFIPTDTDQTDVTFEVTGDKVITVDDKGHIISDGTPGITEVTITSVADPTISKTVPITVLVTEITSSVYDVRRNVELSDYIDVEPTKVNYVTYINIYTTVENFKKNFDNDEEFLHVYDADGNEVDDEQYVGTGMTIKLEFKGNTYDELTVIVRGDLNGDGICDSIDISMEIDYIVEKTVVQTVKFFAYDINEDVYIDSLDLSYMTDLFTEKIDHF